MPKSKCETVKGKPWNALSVEGYSEYFDLTGLNEAECDALVDTEVAHWVEAMMDGIVQDA